MKTRNRLEWLKTIPKGELMRRVLETAARAPLSDNEVEQIDLELARRGVVLAALGKPELDDGCPICLIQRKQTERLQRQASRQ